MNGPAPPIFSEDVCAGLVEHAPDGILLSDRNGTIVYANPSLEKMFGYPSGSLCGSPLEQLVPSAQRERHVQLRLAREEHYRSHAMASNMSINGLRADGSEFAVAVRLGSFESMTGPLVAAFVSDLSEIERQKKELVRLNRALGLVHECNETLVHAGDEATLLDGICGHLYAIGGYQAILVCESLVSESHGAEGMRLLGDALSSVATIPEQVRVLVRQAITQSAPVTLRVTPASAGAPDGMSTWIALPFPPGDGVAGALVIGTGQHDAFNADEERLLVELADDLAYGIDTLRGRAERSRQAAELRRQSHYDSLTGLPNRWLLVRHIDDVLDNATAAQAGLMVVGLDHFARINEAFGHAAGDAVLASVAERLQTAVRRGDTLARVSGDQFAILLTELASDEHLELVANKIRGALRAPFTCQGGSAVLTASIGACQLCDAGGEASALIARAEIAMLAAKATGRNGFRHYSDGLQAGTRARMHLEQALLVALERGELEVHYQPQVSLASGRIVGAEALLRWNHPELGRIPPAQFIPIAEDTGQIVAIGHWVFETACRQAAAWQAAGLEPITMAVNLSARQFRERQLEASIAATLASTGLSPELLVLEVTESLLMEDIESARKLMASLKALGIRIAIDDFGTGYSSLAYLKRLPLSTLKVDRAFVGEIASDPNDAAIVAAVIAMAQALNLAVVAEGVETPAQLEFLRRHGCHEIQGYLFSPPVAADEFTQLLQNGQQLLRLGPLPLAPT